MPISTNAPFNGLGHSMVLRDIEQLWLSLQDTDAALRGITSGDMNGGGGASAGQANPNDALGGPGSLIANGSVAGGDLYGTYPNPLVVGLRGTPISTTPPLYGQALFYDGAQYTPATLTLPVVHYLGTLDVPVFGSGGNARGQYSVDWQQQRSADTQVASGGNATISGGKNNTASADYSTVVGGQSNTASGSNSIAGGNGSAASGISSVALGHTAAASGQDSVAIGLTAAASATGACAFGAATASASNALALQGGAATAADGTAIGYGSACAGARSAVLGLGSILAGGDDSSILGCKPSAGSASQISAVGCVAVGADHSLTHSDNLAFGRGATSTQAGDVWIKATTDVHLVGSTSAGNGIKSTCNFYRNGTQILTTQQSAVTAPTGGATIDSQARTAINDLISRLQSHGLIA